MGAFLLLLITLGVWSLARATADAAAAGVWTGTAEGIAVDNAEHESGGSSVHSTANYQVELSFSFSVSPGGDVVGGGSGYYTDAHWHLSGVNEGKSFGCEPPVTGEPFKVEVSGHKSGHDVMLSLNIPDATETNENYECGANFSGFATTSHAMSESLEVVGGNKLHLSDSAPTSEVLEETVGSHGDASEGSKEDDNIWTISVTPPASDDHERPPDQGGGGSCSLSLSHVVAKPSPGHAGKPISVSFHVSEPAKAKLLVSALGAPSSTVVTRNIPRGHNELLWSGWLGKGPAAAGDYSLTVEAKACGKTRTHAVTVTTH
jgi:hypothetical protein